MPKKQFSQGLNDLFQASGEASTAAVTAAEGTVRERRSGGSKNFVHDLETLFEEAMRQTDELEEGETRSTSADPYPLRSAGLDALIRPTQVAAAPTDVAAPELKRLTITVERRQLEQLRTLARIENLYLKDILQRAIEEYLKKHGSVLS